jgi:hypothetical protein
MIVKEKAETGRRRLISMRGRREGGQDENRLVRHTDFKAIKDNPCN